MISRATMHGVVAAIFLAAIPAVAIAEPTDAERRAVNAAFEQVRTDYRVVLTCSVFDVQTSVLVEEIHNEGLEIAVGLLTDAGFTESEVAAEIAATRIEALRLPDDMLFSDVIEFCRSHPNWTRDLSFMNFLPLDMALERALEIGVD